MDCSKAKSSYVAGYIQSDFTIQSFVEKVGCGVGLAAVAGVHAGAVPSGSHFTGTSAQLLQPATLEA